MGQSIGRLNRLTLVEPVVEVIISTPIPVGFIAPVRAHAGVSDLIPALRGTCI